MFRFGESVGGDMRGLVITGASSGLGKELALQYATDGCALGLIGRDFSRLNDVAHLCRLKGAIVEIGILDVCDDAAQKQWFCDFDARYPLSLVVINAGVTGSPSSGEVLEHRDVAQNLVDVNLSGAIKTAEVVVPLMLARNSGKIAFVSSLAAWRGMALTPVYSATKAGIKAYAEALYDLLSKKGIRVSLICPGFIETPMSEQFPGPRHLMISAEKAALLIKSGLARDRFYIAFPWIFDLGLRVISFLPHSICSYIFKVFSLDKK